MIQHDAEDGIVDTAYKVSCVAVLLFGYSWGCGFLYMTGFAWLSLLFGAYCLAMSGLPEGSAFLSFLKKKTISMVLKKAFLIGKITRSFGMGLKEKTDSTPSPLADSMLHNGYAEILFRIKGVEQSILVPYDAKARRRGKMTTYFVCRDGEEKEIPTMAGVPLLVSEDNLGGSIKYKKSRRRFSK